MIARKKRGRPPSIWHGQSGKEFVKTVVVLQYERRPMTTAKAIGIVRKRPDFAHLQKYKIRYLEKQILDAIEFWSPYSHKNLIGRGNPIYWNKK
jgi:hypothetical protein